MPEKAVIKNTLGGEKPSVIKTSVSSGRLLDAEFQAAFEAASLENQATGFAAHTSTKSMYAGATASFWLVSSFWHMAYIIPDSPTFLKPNICFFEIMYFYM